MGMGRRRGSTKITSKVPSGGCYLAAVSNVSCPCTRAYPCHSHLPGVYPVLLLPPLNL